jgi:hypothetical protein
MVARGIYRERGEKDARRCGDIRRIEKKEELKPKGRNILKPFHRFDLHLQQQTPSRTKQNTVRVAQGPTLEKWRAADPKWRLLASLHGAAVMLKSCCRVPDPLSCKKPLSL